MDQKKPKNTPTLIQHNQLCYLFGIYKAPSYFDICWWPSILLRSTSSLLLNKVLNMLKFVPLRIHCKKKRWSFKKTKNNIVNRTVCMPKVQFTFRNIHTKIYVIHLLWINVFYGNATLKILLITSLYFLIVHLLMYALKINYSLIISVIYVEMPPQ